MNLNPKNKDLIRIAHEIGIEHAVAALTDERGLLRNKYGEYIPPDRFLGEFVKKPDRDIQDEVRRRIR